jgi:hypothetical protein
VSSSDANVYRYFNLGRLHPVACVRSGDVAWTDKNPHPLVYRYVTDSIFSIVWEADISLTIMLLVHDLVVSEICQTAGIGHICSK